MSVPEKRSGSAGATEILPTHTTELFSRAVDRASELLRVGKVVALPTETVYGLAANAFDPSAVEMIFRIKGRPANNPVIVHVCDTEMARRCVTSWPPAAERLAKAFWPGPLTLVLPRSNQVPDNVTAAGPTVGIRWPSHPFIQAVIRQCGFPLAAPSANLSNQLSPTNAAHVASQLSGKVSLIIDGGQSQVGIESSVIDLTSSPARLLRPGMIHEQALMAVLGDLTIGFGDSEQVLKSPGMLPKHYAPKATLIIWGWGSQAELAAKIAAWRKAKPSAPAPAEWHVIAHTQIPSAKLFARVSVIPHDAEAFARALYAELHECDRAGAKIILVEAVPETSEWRAIADRLNRAAA